MRGTSLTHLRRQRDPQFNLWWVKKFCTYYGSVDDFLLYYSYQQLQGDLYDIYFNNRDPRLSQGGKSTVTEI